MKKTLIAALAILAAVPITAASVAAQTMPLVIQNGSGDRITVTAPSTLEARLDNAVEKACEKPFLRDLKGQELYAACLTEARTQAEQILAERTQPGTELALR